MIIILLLNWVFTCLVKGVSGVLKGHFIHVLLFTRSLSQIRLLSYYHHQHSLSTLTLFLPFSDLSLLTWLGLLMLDGYTHKVTPLCQDQGTVPRVVSIRPKHPLVLPIWWETRHMFGQG